MSKQGYFSFLPVLGGDTGDTGDSPANKGRYASPPAKTEVGTPGTLYDPDGTPSPPSPPAKFRVGTRNSLQTRAVPTVPTVPTPNTVGCDFPAHWTAEDVHEAREERAGIYQFDAGLPRHEAERLAGLVTLEEAINA